MSTALANAYESEIQKIENDVEFLGSTALHLPLDLESATKYACRLYQRSSLQGDLKGLREAEEVIDVVAFQMHRPDDLLLLKANVCFKLHRLDGVRQIFEETPALRETAEGRKLIADLLFQEGQYAEARAAYIQAIEKDHSWDNLARFAHYLSKFEGAEAADEVYAQAEDELTCKQMRSFAWIQLQRGLLDVERGQYKEAANHYERADRAYPGYWMVKEHQAGLLAQKREYQASLKLYLDLAERLRKPEIWQNVGNLYGRLGLSEQGQSFYDRALSAFEESAGAGDVHYYHHLVEFHCSVSRNAGEAVYWARKDLALRQNYSTESALAWALHRLGEHEEAIQWINTALESGVVDAHLFSRAASIFRAARQRPLAASYHQRAHKLNPRHDAFHMHFH